MIQKLKNLSEKALKYRNQLRIALQFNNNEKIKEYSYNLTVINCQIVDIVIDVLERIEKSNSNNVISSPIPSHIQVRKHSPMNFDSIDRDSSK